METERIASGAGTRILDMQFTRKPRTVRHARLMIMDSTPHDSNARSGARLDYRTATPTSQCRWYKTEKSEEARIT